jgi:hypothetical protein
VCASPPAAVDTRGPRVSCYLPPLPSRLRLGVTPESGRRTPRGSGPASQRPPPAYLRRSRLHRAASRAQTLAPAAADAQTLGPPHRRRPVSRRRVETAPSPPSRLLGAAPKLRRKVRSPPGLLVWILVHRVTVPSSTERRRRTFSPSAASSRPRRPWGPPWCSPRSSGCPGENPATIRAPQLLNVVAPPLAVVAPPLAASTPPWSRLCKI